MINKGLVLLSGGLDSLVSLDIALKTVDVKLALIFNYGQRPFKEEKKAATDIAKHYNIDYKIINLPYLEEIIKEKSNHNNDLNDIKTVWVPNRNGLFLNIAATFCEAYNYDTIIFGANKQEACEFPDNTVEFVDLSNKTFEYSTIKQVKVYAPCLQFDKIQIINYAINNSLPLNLIKSCYDSSAFTGKKHCGKCMSCMNMYNAILKSEKPELIKEIF